MTKKPKKSDQKKSDVAVPKKSDVSKKTDVAKKTAEATRKTDVTTKKLPALPAVPVGSVTAQVRPAPVTTKVTRLPPLVGATHRHYEELEPALAKQPAKKLPTWNLRDLARKLPKVDIPPYRPARPYDGCRLYAKPPRDDSPVISSESETETVSGSDDGVSPCDYKRGPLLGDGHRPPRLLRALDADKDKQIPALRPSISYADEVDELRLWRAFKEPLPPTDASKPPQPPGKRRPRAIRIRRRLLGSKYENIVPDDAVYFVPTLDVPVQHGNYVQP